MLDVSTFARVTDGAALGVSCHPLLCSGAGLLASSSARNARPQESHVTGQLTELEQFRGRS